MKNAGRTLPLAQWGRVEIGGVASGVRDDYMLGRGKVYLFMRRTSKMEWTNYSPTCNNRK